MSKRRDELKAEYDRCQAAYEAAGGVVRRPKSNGVYHTPGEGDSYPMPTR